ncbi:MAG: S9 family peptidase [Chloroflexi bacterium]|nr:S9 family peptidase [Chloroflexota bacterium]
MYVLDGYGRSPRRLTANDDVIHVFGSWHPDGRVFAYSSNERDPRFFDVYLLDVETGARHVLWQHDATHYAECFAPDGASLLVRRVDAPFDQHVFRVGVASGEVTPVAVGGPPSVYESLAWTPEGQQILTVTDRERDLRALVRIDPAGGQIVPAIETDADVDDFALSPDGRTLVYTLNRGGSSEVYLRDMPSGADHKLDVPTGQVYDGYRWVPTFSWHPDSSAVAFAFSRPTTPADVFLARTEPGASGDRVVDVGAVQQVTRSWRAGLDAADLAAAERVHYPTFDGREIPTWVFTPPDARRDGTAPALFFVHGGPESQTRAIFNPIVQYFASCGFTVVAPNVRGSAGYGRAYLALDDVERRMDSVADLAAGAEWAARTGLAHPKRIAVMGGSYGGFMVLAALTSYPRLWAAGVDIVGIANFVTFLENTGPWRRHLREAEYGSLARDRAFLESISPIHKADQITAPLLVIHGANDPRVPISEAEQIVARLRELGRTVEYLRYADEGHGLARLHNRLDAYPCIADFLQRHLTVTLDAVDVPRDAGGT